MREWPPQNPGLDPIEKIRGELEKNFCPFKVEPLICVAGDVREH